MQNKEKFSNRQMGIIGKEQFRQYAVLIPIIDTLDGVFLLFEKRSNKLSHQPGEICFPGGKLEIDESLQECAVRETIEELQIFQQQIEILGPGDVFISPFNLMIHPFIGAIKDFPYEWIPGGENYPWAEGTYDIFFYHYENWVIWGITARIVKSAVELIDQYNLR